MKSTPYKTLSRRWLAEGIKDKGLDFAEFWDFISPGVWGRFLPFCFDCIQEAAGFPAR